MKTQQGGFTMIEMMVTVAILATSLGIAAPQFQNFTAGQSMRAASFDLTTDLLLARSEAVKRNSQVVITALGGQWSQGWTVVDAVSGETLGRSKPLQGNVLATNVSGLAAITFNRDGRTNNPVATQVQLERKLGGSSLYRCITLEPTGLPRIMAEKC